MPARVAAPADLLCAAVSRIFDQVQTSTANHQKNFIALHKLHLDAAQRTQPNPKGGDPIRVGEHEFQQIFHDMLSRVLMVKKGVTTADRVAKFCGSYVPFINQRAAEDKEHDDDDIDTDTVASRFTAKVLSILLRGFHAKDKNVRYRVISLLSDMLVYLGELDVDIYNDIRKALLDRIHDKEVIVRVQVVVSLSKFSEDSSDTEEEQSVLDVLLETLASDPSAEVRRAVLCNIPLNKDTLPVLLARSRDTDTNVRKVLFNFVLTNAAGTAAGNPRALTIAQRELIVRNGLGDREPAVRDAAASLLETWIDTIGETVVKTEEELASRLADVDISNSDKSPQAASNSEKIVNTLTAFLRMFDLTVVSTDARGEQLRGQIPADALRSLFSTRPEILEELHFGEPFFSDLTPEKAFLARVFVQFCVGDQGRGEERMDNAGIPVVTSCAFRIQHGYNALVEPQINVDASEEERDDTRAAAETVVGEMLRLALQLDYGDYVGSMKMSGLTRDMLSRPELPLNLIPPCLDVLRKVSKDERDLIRVVVEIVQDLRDSGDEEDDIAANQSQGSIIPDDGNTSFSSDKAAVSEKSTKTRELMSPEEQQRADAVDLRCLFLLIELLKRVDDTLDKNSTLLGIRDDLIVPSITSKNAELRRNGFVTLGLYCLISESDAIKCLPIFFGQMQAAASEGAKLSFLQIIFDLCMAHRAILSDAELAEKIKTSLMTQLMNETDREVTSAKILAVLTQGIAKFALNRWSTDAEVLKPLLMVYFSPYNADNQALKQCVAYFAPAYSHSSPANQRVMRNIFTPVFRKLSTLRQSLDEDLVLDLSQVAEMWRYWTDPFQLHDPDGRTDHSSKANDPIQFDMAGDIIRAMLKEEFPKEDKKVLCQMLGKLHIPDKVDIDKIRTLKLLIHTLNLRRPLRDATSRNTFKKFDEAISKKFEVELQDFDEEEYRKLEQLKSIFEELDDILPEDDEVISTEPKKKGRKRRSDSIISMTTESDNASVASSKRMRSKPKTKKRRLSTSDDDESDFDDDNSTPKGTPPPPTRTLPRRAAAVHPTPIVISSDDDDQEATPAAHKRRSRATKSRSHEEAIIDADIDDLLEGETTEEIPHDSIMDDSDEEDEVNDLLVDD